MAEPRLSLKSGKPIAIVRGGKLDGKIVYITEDQNVESLPISHDNIIQECKVIRGGSRYKLDCLDKIAYAIKLKTRPTELDLQPIYDKIMSTQKVLSLDDGNFEQIPNPDTRECLFISGPSGSGKSTMLGRYMRQYKKLFPKNPIYLFSKFETDEAFDGIKVKRIPINMDLVDDPIDIEEFEDSLVCFDDDQVSDKELEKALEDLKRDLLERGRHHNTYVAILNHLLTDYKKTRSVLNESHAVCFFPKAGSSYQIKYCLKTYCSMDTKDIAKMMKLPSRAVILNKQYPQYVIAERDIYLVCE